MNHRTLLVWLFIILGAATGKSAEPLTEVAVFQGRTSWIERAALSPDGKILASGGGNTEGGELKLWDVSTGKEIARLAAYSNSLYALAFSADSRRLASGDSERRVIVWDVERRKSVGTFQHKSDRAHVLTFSPDGKRLASAGTHEVRVWDVEAGKALTSFERSVGSWAVAFNKDLNTLASGNYPDIDLWDVANSKERFILSEHRGAVRCVAFVPDDRTLVSASAVAEGFRSSRYRGEVKLWDVTTGRQRAILKGPFPEILGLTVSPDGKTLALLQRKSLHDGEGLRVWDLGADREVYSYQEKPRRFLYVTFTRDGRLFLMSTDNSAVQLYEVPFRKNGHE